MGVPPFLMNASIIGVMGQRLVRKLCQHCKGSYEPDEGELELIRGAYKAEDHPERLLMYKGKGCKFCNHLGYSGRIGIFEIMIMSNEMRALIMKSTAIHEVKRLARQQHMATLWESGVKKVLRGMTSLEELLRNARPDYEEDAEFGSGHGRHGNWACGSAGGGRSHTRRSRELQCTVASTAGFNLNKQGRPAGPPCTGFSRANPENHMRDDQRNSLVRRRPSSPLPLSVDIVVMENARELIRGNFKHHYEWFRGVPGEPWLQCFGRTYMLSRFGLLKCENGRLS